MKAILAAAPRYLFFTGKGGVGKTSMACATSAVLASSGRRVLLVSTDPASNLDEVLETPLGPMPVPVRSIERLDAMNIDPEAAAARYRERIVGPFRGILPEASVRSIEEQLSGACTVEIASFNEFTRLIGDEEAVAGYDHVVLDTAPTGHTLRLLSLPAAWNDFIAENKSGSSCLGPLAGLKDQKLIYEKSVRALTDPRQTLLVLVSRPEVTALKEASRASAELAGLGIKNQTLIVNGVFRAVDHGDHLAAAFEGRGRGALAAMPEGLRGIPRIDIPFRASGFASLEAIRTAFDAPVHEGPAAGGAASGLTAGGDFAALLDKLSEAGSGVIMTMGKGGVGKTTLAAAIAIGLARRGKRVHLSTTDPAAHVGDTVGGDVPNLLVSRIDPEEETRRHIQHVMESAGAKLDGAGRALLEEELRSPCTEEVAVFQAFARMVAQGQDHFVVLDTAPTGHTLLLLDATEAYHREVLRNASAVPEAVRELLPRLRDSHYTKVLLVALPEATPVHEAAQLQSDLRRAGIEPYAWIINQSFAAAGPSDPILAARARNEIPYIDEAIGKFSSRNVLIPWMDRPLFDGENAQITS